MAHRRRLTDREADVSRRANCQRVGNLDLFGKYDAPSREQADHIRAMLARLPKCRWCRKGVVGGQVDGEGQPSHFQCQIAFLLLSKPNRKEAPINPRLPQAEYLNREVREQRQLEKGSGLKWS